MVPKTIKNDSKIHPESYLILKTWFSQKQHRAYTRAPFLRMQGLLNSLKIVKKWSQNHSKIRLKNCSNFASIFYRCWLHFGSQNWSKMALEMVKKTYQKIHSKIIEKRSQKGLQNGGTPITGRLLFEVFFWTFSGLAFSKCQGPPGDPK